MILHMLIREVVMDIVYDIIDYLRDFNVVSILIRLVLAMFMGGTIGLERGKQ